MAQTWNKNDLAWISEFQLGISNWGLAELSNPLSINAYDSWLAAGYHGEMQYLKKHRDYKANSKLWDAELKSALVFTISYAKIPKRNSTTFPGLRTALYSTFPSSNDLDTDYHHELPKRLTPILNRLQSQYPDAKFRITTDSAPVLERDLARKAGLGWIGLNTCLIDRKSGSLNFIVEILSTLSVTQYAELTPDHCGTCQKCLEACPTNALTAPRTLDAQKCISYWTIEAKHLAPISLSEKFGDWFFGCDICQTVCPWNQKIFREAARPTSSESKTDDAENTLAEILTASSRPLINKTRDTAFQRALPNSLKRNALYVIGANNHLQTEKTRDALIQLLAKLEEQNLESSPENRRKIELAELARSTLKNWST